MQSTLLVHVPKTGGTTVDDLLADACDPGTSLRRLHNLSPIADWERLDEPGLTYLSGHVPTGAIDIGRFDQRITVLRPPLELLASRLSYDSRYFGKTSKQVMADGDARAPVYGLYFSPGYDRLRYLTERSYGVPGWISDYVDRCTVQEALQTLARFDRVIDFHQLDGELKRLTMELGLFPRSQLPRLRAYDYQPDEAAAGQLVSDFDLNFYQHARQRFKPLPAELDVAYERYRRLYCQQQGLRLAPRASLALPLTGPLGNGWFLPEQADNGAWFRWANGFRPTLEIPLASPGLYLISVYVHPHGVRGLHLAGKVEGTARRVVMLASERAGVTVLQTRVRVQQPDWVQLQFDADGVGDAAQGDLDLVERSFVLGRVLLRRGPE